MVDLITITQLDEQISKRLASLKAQYGEIEVEKAIEITRAFKFETAAWLYWIGFGGIGDRFAGAGGNYNPLGAARNNEEIAEDAGLVNKLTAGSAPFVGAHVLWQFVNKGGEADLDIAKQFAEQLRTQGVSLGSVSPTYFIGNDNNCSFSSLNKETRNRFIDQTVLAADIAHQCGVDLLTLWFPDGTNLPGQRQLQDIDELMHQSMNLAVSKIPEPYRKLLKILQEYKLFEPGTYSTAVALPLHAYLLAQTITKAGAQGGVLVDLGHHDDKINIEQIVATFIRAGVPCGFHFNGSYAADDDHPVEPTMRIARICHELLYDNVVNNTRKDKNWAYALDQMPRAEQRIPAALKSIEALKISMARAALYNLVALTEYQSTKDLIGANREQEKALLADTRPIVMEAYRRAGVHPDPFTAYRESRHQEQIQERRNRAA